MTLLHSSATGSQPECTLSLSSQELCRALILTIQIQDVYRRAVSLSPLCPGARRTEKWSHYCLYELSWQGGDTAPQTTQYLLSLTVQTAQALSNGPLK